ncbi:glycosyltransferase [Legionella lytica]|uniref:Glycosyltransferase n=1 Tax=Legionella lytica TaxID=96232 RepID=A0ABW8DC93_9GAMM
MESKEENIQERLIKVFHFVWVGGDIPEKYLLNLKAAVTEAEKIGYTVNLWVDNPMRFYKNAAKMDINFYNRLKLREINELNDFINLTFKDEGVAPKIIARIRQEMVGNRNYSAVTDWLRILILLKEGGIYSDIDNKYLKTEQGIDVYLLPTMPSEDELLSYINRGIIVGNQFYCLTEINKKQILINVPIADVPLLNDLVTQQKNNKIHLTPEQFSQCIGKPCPSIITRNRVNWKRNSIFKVPASSSGTVSSFEQAVESLPYGIKLYGKYSENRQTVMKEVLKAKSIVDETVVSAIDNSYIVAHPGNKVLKATILAYLKNYDEMDDVNDLFDALVFIGEAKDKHLNNLSMTDKERIQSLEEDKSISCYDNKRHYLTFRKYQDGKILMFKHSDPQYTELEIKRAPDTLEGGRGRRNLCGVYHAALTIVNCLAEIHPDANVSDVLITPEQLTNVQLQWDNNWFGKPEWRLPFEDYNALISNKFGKNNY